MSDTLPTGHFVAAARDAPMIGAVLGNYRIIEVMNVGGMGTVYRAQHELLDRPAAIKLLRPELTESDELVDRFFNEAKAATAIRHPGIVEVYDFGHTDEGLAYLVMEFLDGQPLSVALAERGRFPELEAAQVARNIASALKAAHAKGIIHRDLKPDNIFLVPDPDGRESRVKVLDFGIAKLANPPPTDRRRTQTGVLMGTPKYMAPEQAREAATIDQRADLYSLGCILYELLVGEPPFVAVGAGEIIAMQLFTEPEPPSRRADLSPELDSLVLRLLAKEPGERPQTAADVMEALAMIGARMSALRDVAVDARDGSGVRSAFHDTIPSMPSAELSLRAPAAKRSKLPFVLAGCTLALVAATVVFLLSRKSPDAAPPATPPPIVERAPAPVPPPPAPVVETQPVVVEATPVVEPVVKKKPVTKPSAKPEPKPEPKTVDAKIEPKLETKKPLTTDNKSPIETDIGDGPRQPKAP